MLVVKVGGKRAGMWCSPTWTRRAMCGLWCGFLCRPTALAEQPQGYLWGCCFWPAVRLLIDFNRVLSYD